MQRQTAYAVIGLAALGFATLALKTMAATSPAIVALVYLLVVLSLASLSAIWTAVLASIAAMLCLNFFFLPPIGTLTVSDPQNWVVLVIFLIVSVAASKLSATARARARAAQRVELSSALLASLSHDLRTPLTAIKTALANMRLPALPEDQRQAQARLASDELDRLTRLFDEILDMARIDAGGVEIDCQWVTPGEVVEAAIAHASSTLAARDLRVTTDEEHTISIDPRLTAQALVHLLENAARHAPAGAIEIHGWTDHAGLRIDVTDNGPGVASGDAARIFERFYRTEAARQRVPGTGMGLSIARGLLAVEGGRVWADTTVTHGAKFSIAVPAPTRERRLQP